jgi:hypothetical protein
MAQFVERLSSSPIVTHTVVYDTHIIYYALQSACRKFIECARIPIVTDAVRITPFVSMRSSYVRVEDGELIAYSKKRCERTIVVHGVQKILVASDPHVLILNDANRLIMLTLCTSTSMLKSALNLDFVLGKIVSAVFITPTKLAILDDTAALNIYSLKQHICRVTIPGVPTYIAGACNDVVYCVVINSLVSYLAEQHAHIYTVDQEGAVKKTDIELPYASRIAVVGASLLYANNNKYWTYAFSTTFSAIKPTRALPTSNGVFVSLDDQLNPPI